MEHPHWSSGLSEFGGQPVTQVHEEDRGGSYEFDAVAIVESAGSYHVVSSSGCSCPSHEERAQHDAGPFATYDEALARVPGSHREGFPASA